MYLFNSWTKFLKGRFNNSVFNWIFHRFFSRFQAKTSNILSKNCVFICLKKLSCQRTFCEGWEMKMANNFSCIFLWLGWIGIPAGKNFLLCTVRDSPFYKIPVSFSDCLGCVMLMTDVWFCWQVAITTLVATCRASEGVQSQDYEAYQPYYQAYQDQSQGYQDYDARESQSAKRSVEPAPAPAYHADAAYAP